MASGTEQTSSSRRARKRYYVEGSDVPFEEDHYHEFKAHKNLTMEDIPPHSKLPGSRTRAPISRAINAFLNTGDGGTVYIGILDSGTVQGLNLTQFQKDHMIVSLHDVMGSFTPQVESHRYSVKFIPVIEQHNTPKEIDEILSFDSTKNIESETRLRPHVFRTHNYCWCDKDSVARYNMGTSPPLYVIEIIIKAWDPNDVRNQNPSGVGQMKIHPIHTDEQSKAYFRKQASMVQYTTQEIYQLSKLLVSNHYQPRIKELQQKIKEAKEAAKNPSC